MQGLGATVQGWRLLKDGGSKLQVPRATLVEGRCVTTDYNTCLFPCCCCSISGLLSNLNEVGLRLRYTVLMIFITNFSNFFFNESKQV